MSKVILGKNFAGIPTTAHEVLNAGVPRNDVIVEGIVRPVQLDKENRGIFKKNVGKAGSFLTKFAVWDGTNTINVSVFNPAEFAEVEVGMGVRVLGHSESNEYSKGEYFIQAQSIMQYDLPVKKRVEEAVLPRVELSLRTNMSQLQSRVPAKDYIKGLKEMGYSRMFITDVNSIQAYPDAYQVATKEGMELLMGTTLEIFDENDFTVVFDEDDRSLKGTSYVTFDVETTGFSARFDHIIELGAAKFVDGECVEVFQCFVKTPKRISEKITELTGITNEMVEAEGIELEEAIKKFDEFRGDAVLVAHNATFDRGFLKMAYRRLKQSFPKFVLLDTLNLSRAINTVLKNHRLGTVAEHYDVSLKNAHRAHEDAKATGDILMKMVDQLEDMGVTELSQLNALKPDEAYKSLYPNQITVLVKNETGKKNLYKLISIAHTQYVSNHGGQLTAKISKQELEKYREGLIIGSGSHKSRLFDLALNKAPDDVLREAEYYDFIEIQPVEISSHWTKDEDPKVSSIQDIEDTWKMIYMAAKKLGKPVVATGFVQYLNPEDRIYNQVLIYSEKVSLSKEKRRGGVGREEGYSHFRTNEEMMNEFPWLSEEERYEVVVTNSNAIADQCQMLNPVPEKLYTPKIPHADAELEEMVWKNAKARYGDPLPQVVKDRIEKELDKILTYGFGIIYWSSSKVVVKSNEDGYLVGSRGSVGSSIVATFSNITEVNPLPPHYVCPNCQHSEFITDGSVGSGYDLPEKDCVLCDTPYIRDGQDIPFETFLGFKGDKVPDIDLNFSGEYQGKAHKYVEELFGEKYVYRAGTIATVADKIAKQFAKKYSDDHGLGWSWAEVERVAELIEGSKRSTGQHPGGMLVVPDYMEMEDFAPFQYPANNKFNKQTGAENSRTSHFDFHAIHDYILKMDILGHDQPTIFRQLQDLTGVDPKTVPSADPHAMKLFYKPEEVLGFPMSEIGQKCGTLCIPEMNTKFVMDMLVDTKPKTFAELVQISGLSHGTDVWVGNAQKLILDDTCELKDVIGCRDDIMVYLIYKGLESSLAFKIMESVRKGKGLTPEMEEAMREKDVPEWYIWSCKLIKYMFPKAHAVAYVLDATRMAYYKTYYPLEFYCAYFSAKFRAEDSTEFTKPIDMLKRRIKELEAEHGDLMRKREKNKAKKINDLKRAVEVALEAKMRGVQFGKVRLYGSHATRYVIHNGELVPPFSSIPGIGIKAAVELFQEARKAPFKSLPDLVERTKLKKNNVEALLALGCLESVKEKDHSFF